MIAVTSSKMRQIDKTTIEEFKIPGILLMEAAARSVVEEIKMMSNKEDSILIVCGTGNNGGDGFAVGRMLVHEGYEVEIMVLGKEEAIQGDAAINLKSVHKLGISISHIFSGEQMNLVEEKISDYGVIVDAIFGTGLTREIGGFHKEAVEIINHSGKTILSIDIASGIHSDTGEELGIAVRANRTVTFAFPKVGLLVYPGADYTGNLVCKDIGIPCQVIDKMSFQYQFLVDHEAYDVLPVRQSQSNKGTYGKVLLICGSKDMTGAAVLAGKGAYRIGAGLVTLCIPECIQKVVQQSLFEAVTLCYDGGDYMGTDDQDKIIKQLKKADAVVFGPGMGQNNIVKELLSLALKYCPSPIVIDADGLNNLAQNQELLKNLEDHEVVITPHPGEMSRLIEKPISYVVNHSLQVAREFSKKYGVITVLKSARTIIAHPDGRININCSGNNGMATGGSGDVLAGIIGGLIGQQLLPYDAAVLGAYIHGKAGDLAAEQNGEYAMIASDIVDCLGDAVKKIKSLKEFI